jgi:hypothetical protein
MDYWEDKINPCRNCGGKGILTFTGITLEKKTVDKYRVECRRCWNMTDDHPFEEAAIAEWNKQNE